MSGNTKIIIGLFAFCAFLAVLLFVSSSDTNTMQEKSGNNAVNKNVSITEGDIVFVPIGDSYTIGNGLQESERWPNLLTEHLREEGIPVVLAENPAVSGWTIQMAIDTELPVVERIQPDLVTVFIGANDVFRGTREEIFENDYRQLLDDLEKIVPEAKIILITIPDYTVSPAGLSYGSGRAEQEKLEAANTVIRQAGEDRGYPVADLTEVSRAAGPDPAMFIDDGLHPSAAQMIEWEKEIFPIAKDLFTQ